MLGSSVSPHFDCTESGEVAPENHTQSQSEDDFTAANLDDPGEGE